MSNLYKKVYFLKNFETKENISFEENNVNQSKLKELNQKGWNVYESVNTFIWKDRKSENIAEIKSCFIDIDYPEILDMTEKERASFLKDKYWLVKNHLKNIKEKYWLTPSTINLTYKGFHILFNYSKDLYFIDLEQHLIVNNKLNEILGGDENARDVSRVFKSVWFIDWKWWKKWIIKNLLSYESEIQLENLEYLIWKKISFRKKEKIDKKKETKDKQSDNISKNIEKINKIDSSIFIEKILENLEKYPDLSHLKKLLILNPISESKFSFCEKNWVDSTSWLMLEKENDWIWRINDYSKKTRRWNYNFLKNWILEWQHFSLFSKFLYEITNWITLNLDTTKKIPIDMKLFWDKVNKNFSYDLESLPTEDKEAFKDYTKDMLLKLDPETSLVFFWIFALIDIKNKQPIYDEVLKANTYSFEWDELVEILWKNKSNIARDKAELRKHLLICSSFRVPIKVQTKDWNWTSTTWIFNVIFLGDDNKGGRWNKSKFLIVPLRNEQFSYSKNIWFFNQKILSKPLKAELKNLIFKIEFYFNHSNVNFLYFECSELFRILWLNSTEFKTNIRGLKKHLDYRINENLIKEYKYNEKNKTITFYKSKIIEIQPTKKQV